MSKVLQNIAFFPDLFRDRQAIAGAMAPAGIFDQ